MRLDIVARCARADLLSEAGCCQLLLEGDWPEPASTSPRRLTLEDEIDGSWQWIDREADRLADLLLQQPPEPAIRLGDLRLDWLSLLELRYYLVKLLRVVSYLDPFLARERTLSVRLLADPHQDADYIHLVGELCRLHKVAFDMHPLAATSPAKAARPGSLLKKPSHSKRGATGSASAGTIGQFPSGTSTGRASGTLPQQAARSRESRFARWRETCAWLNRRLDRPHAGPELRRSGSASGRRSRRGQGAVILCGNPTLFEPLCSELIRHTDYKVYVLYEKFAFRFFARWRWRGVRMLDCSTDEVEDNSTCALADGELSAPTPAAHSAKPLLFRNVDLGPPVADWLARQGKLLRAPLTRAISGISEHYDRIRPDWLLVDEDATPFKRVAVALARERGIATGVLQHGAPYVSFGFAPLAANTLFAWGESSRRQFRSWGIPDEAIVVTGCPKHDPYLASFSKGPPNRSQLRRSRSTPPGPVKHLLLLASVHHAPERPDVVGFHLTARTNAEMVRWALEAIEERTLWRLTIKLHPRTPDPGFFEAVVDSLPQLRSRVRLLRSGDVLALAQKADCVLSCASSAGIEATIAGKPVIQLMPPGSGDLVDPHDWGFAGTARSLAELEGLLSRIECLDTPDVAGLEDVFANRQTPAADQIVDRLGRESSVCVGREA